MPPTFGTFQHLTMKISHNNEMSLLPRTRCHQTFEPTKSITVFGVQYHANDTLFLEEAILKG